jgi:ribosome-binding protein aMBF1 (putative translation factor)
MVELRHNSEPGQCKYCGSTQSLRLRKDGRPGTVCRQCRRIREAQRRGRISADRCRLPRKKPPPNEPPEQRMVRIKKAVQRADRYRISLVDALKQEGVI